MPLTVTSNRIYSLVPQSSFAKLLECFRDHISDPSLDLNVEVGPTWRAWCRFAFALISFGGLAGPRHFQELCSLKFEDVNSAPDGYIMIPRWGGQVPLYIDDLIAICTVSLGIHLYRDIYTEQKLEGLFPSQGYLLPGRNNPKSVPTQKDYEAANVCFSVWLQSLADQAGIREKITRSRLLQLSRGRLTKIYAPSIAGAMLGLHRYNPAPPHQSSSFAEYRMPLEFQETLLRAHNENSINDIANPRLPLLKHAGRPGVFTDTTSENLPLSFKMIRDIVNQFSRANKRSAKRRKRKVLEQLRAVISKMERELEKTWAVDWRAYISEVREDELPCWKIDGINATLLAHWMVALISQSPPSSVAARLDDLASFLRSINCELLSNMREEQISDLIVAREISARSRERLASSIRAFFRFLRVELEINIPEIGLWHIGWVNSVNETPLLLQASLEQILSGTDPSRPEIVIAIILAYYFGLRASEVCDLRIGHLQFGTRVTVYVMKSKGGRSRHIEGVEIPRDVIKYLQNFHSERMRAVQGDMSQPLLTNSEGRRLSRQLLSRLWKQIVNSKNVDLPYRKEFSSIHSLRHACTNRWLALGVPLVDIARMLGHQSIETTVSSYVHSFNFKQKEQLDEHLRKSKPFLFTTKGLANLLGLTPRRVRQICRAEDIHFHRLQGKHYYSQKDVLMLLESYFSNLLTPTDTTFHIREQKLR